MSIWIGVPLRKDEDGGSPRSSRRLATYFKVTAVDRVVFRVRRDKRARKRQQLLDAGNRLQGVLARRRRRKEVVGVGHHAPNPIAQEILGTGLPVRVRRPVPMPVLRNPLEPPLEGTGDTLGGDGSEPALPAVEEDLK